jgi:hypothetical protein
MAVTARSLVSQYPLLEPTAAPQRPILVPDPPAVEVVVPAAVQRVREALDPATAAKVISGTELARALAKSRREEVIATSIDGFDLLLGGGLPRGKVVEVVGRRASGRFAIVLAAVAAATSAGEAAALIDLGDHLDPQIVDAMGADLRRLLWVRPQTLKEAVMSAEMIIATGFSLIAFDAGVHPIRGRRVAEASWVRLARAAEAHGGALIISAPYTLTGTAAEAVVAAERARAQWQGRTKVLDGIALQMRLEKHRHRRPGTHSSITLTSSDSALEK